MRRKGRLENVRARVNAMGAMSLAKAIAREHGVLLDDMLGGTRAIECVAARHRLWTIIADTTGAGWKTLSRIFVVDHTTVMMAVRKRHRALAALHSAFAASEDA